MRQIANLLYRAPVISRPFAVSLVLIGLVILSSGLLSGRAMAGNKGGSVWSAVWSAPRAEVPEWLESLDSTSQLYTEFEFAGLAGKLINFGVVDASACENSGLILETGEATDCGIQAAVPAMHAWQNRFNAAIINAGQANGIPPRLIKNLFAWESQFWPQTQYVNTFEYGLGHITQMGADSALRWDNDLYLSVCAASFNQETCQKDYVDQPDSIRKALQGVIVQKASADCPSCRFNLDLDKAEASISIFARTLLANTRFVEKSVKLLTSKEAADLLTVEDFWRFTLVSYNAGPGCFHTAAGAVYYRGLDLNWNNLKQYLEPACKGSIPYVNFIQQTDAYTPANDPALQPAVTPAPALTAEPVTTETPAAIAAPHNEHEIVLKIDARNPEPGLEALRRLGINLDRKVGQVESLGTYVVEVAPDSLPRLLAALSKQAGIVYAEPNYLVTMSGTPDDPDFVRQSNLTAIQVPQAWDAITSGTEVLVALVDSGIDRAHPDLADRLWQNPGETGVDSSGNDMRFNGLDDDANGYSDDWQGWNMVAGSNDASDDQGHGTHLAGIIGAAVNNATGIAGIAPNARLLPVKVLDRDGQGTHAQVAEGIIYAADMGAKVINLGLGGAGSSEVLQGAVNYAVAKGALVVASSGNTGTASQLYPAGYPGVLAVGAVDASGSLAVFSTQGSHLSLAAPGVDVFSTALGGSYRTGTGTSMAAAHVSGVAALLSGQPLFANVDMLRSALLNSALDLGASGPDEQYGYGILQAYNALGYSGPIVPTPAPTEVPVVPPDRVSAMEQQVVWAAEQRCSGVLTNPDHSIVPPLPDTFDGLYASCSGTMANDQGWTISDFAPAAITLPGIYAATLDLRFYMTGWEDDLYQLQVCPIDAADCQEDPENWIALETFSPANPPPDAPPAASRSYNIKPFIVNAANANVLQARLWGVGQSGSLDTVTMYLDQVSATFVGNTVPAVSITSPLNNAVYAKGDLITFTGVANDAEDGVISTRISWSTDIDGPIGVGTTRTRSNLTPGTHTITATVYDNAGVTTATTVTITITPAAGPHGSFLTFSDGCATCHGAHSEQDGNSSVGANRSNDFCLRCHSDDNKPVSTHSNADAHNGETDGYASEGSFDLLCIQCHNPHGGTGNLFAIRTNVKIGGLPFPYSGMGTESGPVVFTALKGINSFDEVDSPESAENNVDDLCVTCHVNSSNPGYPTSGHAGGANHYGGADYTGVSCIACHPHSFDGSGASRDGFMPVRGACDACHTTQAVSPLRALSSAQAGSSGDAHQLLSKTTQRQCELCHDLSAHMDGQTRLFNADNPEIVYTMDGSNDSAEYQAFCLACHNFDKSSGETSPFGGFLDLSIEPAASGQRGAQGQRAAAGSHYAGECRDCHVSGHGQVLLPATQNNMSLLRSLAESH